MTNNMKWFKKLQHHKAEDGSFVQIGGSHRTNTQYDDLIECDAPL